MAKTKKKWSEMTRDEKRKAVCQDVIDLLNAGKLKPTGKQCYLDVPHTMSDIGPKEVQKMNGCHACARGAMMVAKIMESKQSHWTGGVVAGYDTADALQDVFTEEELTAIERYYEGWTGSDGVTKFYERFPDHTDRMIAIMQNIIDNGEFKPKVEYVVYEV